MKQSRPLDTSAEAERVQIEIFRKMTPEQRLQLAAQLTRIHRKRLTISVRRRHPEYDEDQVRLAVIRSTIPEELFFAAYPHAKDIVP